MSSLSLVIHQMNAKGRSGVIVDKDKVSWGSEVVASVLNLDTTRWRSMTIEKELYVVRQIKY